MLLLLRYYVIVIIIIIMALCYYHHYYISNDSFLFFSNLRNFLIREEYNPVKNNSKNAVKLKFYTKKFLQSFKTDKMVY